MQQNPLQQSKELLPEAQAPPILDQEDHPSETLAKLQQIWPYIKSDIPEEAYILTHQEYFINFMNDAKRFTITKFNNLMTKPVLCSIPYPFKTRTVKRRQAELQELLDDFPILRTLDVDVFIQRLISLYSMNLPNLQLPEYPNIEEIVRENFNTALD